MKIGSAVIRGAIAFGSVFLFTGVHEAVADTFVDMPGLNCHQESGNGGIYKNWFGTVLNDSTTTALVVDCPMPRTLRLDLVPLVMVFDRHTTNGVTCELHSETVLDDGIYQSVTSAVTHGSGPNPFFLYVPTLSAEGDYVYFRCTIPPKQNGNLSGVIDLKLAEQAL
jgi:hypothetical protein